MSEKQIKCLVWDLDNTLWEGTLLENGGARLREGVLETLRTLDSRGVLHSIASKNEPEDALENLRRLGVEEFFLCPQIGWGDKSAMLENVAKQLNIGIDALAFIDDQPFERAEVGYRRPEILCLDAADVNVISDMPRFIPKHITPDSARRREMYRDDLRRKTAESEFSGGDAEFLKTLEMRLSVRPVREGDLERVEELTLRTNQLNSTGVTYSMDELRGFISSEKHTFLIAELDDRFGSYGKIGLMLLENEADALAIRLLIMSCRVMTRGVGSALLVLASRLAAERGRRLIADFSFTGKNRVMYITYKLMGFSEISESEDGSRCLLEYTGGEKAFPDYIALLDDA